jgi:two-component system cell cycle sensor histidine kinase/response regulator CckA
MPGINGKELYDKALLLHEKLKVLFMSGYADNAIAHHNVIESGALFIQKPFSTKSLSKKIREILDSEF